MNTHGLIRQNEGPTLIMEDVPTQRRVNVLFSLVNGEGNVRTMNAIEAEVIRHALQYYDGQMSEVARRLGIGRTTLYRKINKLKISRKGLSL